MLLNVRQIELSDTMTVKYFSLKNDLKKKTSRHLNPQHPHGGPGTMAGSNV